MTDDWFSNEEFWEASFPFMFPEESFLDGHEQVEKILALGRISHGALLDVGCGPGRHSVPFAERGFAVTAVDRNAFLLDRARTYAGRSGVEVSWVMEDMRDFCRPNTYHLAISVFTSFGYFDSQAENQRVLDNVAASLKRGGAFVMDLMGKEVVARRFAMTDSTEVEDVGMVVQRRRIVEDWRKIETDWILIRDSSAREFTMSVWLYSGEELRAMLDAAGFRRVELFGSLDGIPYDTEARRLVAVAEK
jgi:2-polyprenyl-3-methyl-5-hydroxy-6-metoxy-1,4-benzoquinol methylase